MGFYPFEKGDIKKSGYICMPFLEGWHPSTILSTTFFHSLVS